MATALANDTPNREDEVLNLNTVFDDLKKAQESGDQQAIFSAQRLVDHVKKTLTVFYNEVYVPTFPKPEERQPLEYWMDRLEGKGGEGLSKLPVELITVSGKGLTDTYAPAQITAMTLNIYFPESQTALAHYFLKDNSLPQKVNTADLLRGSVEALETTAAKFGGTLKGMFCECDDPKKVSAADSAIDPTLRLRLFQRTAGARVINIDGEEPYIQAHINKGSGTCDILLLLTCALADGSIVFPN